MSRLHKSTWIVYKTIDREAHNIAKNNIEYEIKSCVETYHLRAGYRDINVISNDYNFLTELKNIIKTKFTENYKGNRIFYSINDRISGYCLSVSIWK